MASLTIRGLDDGVKSALRVRAARNGRSMEAEARAILAAAVPASQTAGRLGQSIHELFADVGGADLDVPARDEPARVAEFIP